MPFEFFYKKVKGYPIAPGGLLGIRFASTSISKLTPRHLGRFWCDLYRPFVRLPRI